jgi:hypothetical protein
VDGFRRREPSTVHMGYRNVKKMQGMRGDKVHNVKKMQGMSA